MPTLDWLNRANAFTLSAKVPYRLLEQVSTHHGAAPDSFPLSLGEGRGEGSPHLTPPPDNISAVHDHVVLYAKRRDGW